MHSLVLGVCLALLSAGAVKPPEPVDDRLTFELFAEQPQVVTPTGIAVDDRNRVYVAESHTHFRPDNYDGPKADRILVLRDADKDGRADARAVFHEGFVHIMDIEFARDGSLYVATRRDIHRLRDTNNDGLADEVTPIVRMESKADYPHNGLSGLSFDFSGRLHFGLGENLGETYALVGTDGKRVTGGGEGGSTYRVDANGANLERTTTGWWNPFGVCVDAFGRVFGTDNDPDSSPPCRLIQIVEGGDYGYEYRYGRTGLHPLQTWTGAIPGTLPMIAGTGEAPGGIVAYESDTLPADYYGHLLVASWSDHRVEHYDLTQPPHSGLVVTKRQPLVVGEDEFRPVDVAVAADGTVYVSDWVSSSYTLHKLGRIWRLRPKHMVPPVRPAEVDQALKSRDRRTRERAALKLARSADGRSSLLAALHGSPLPQSRAAALQALALRNDIDKADLAAVVTKDQSPEVRVLALRQLLTLGEDPANWLKPAVGRGLQAEAARRATLKRHSAQLLGALSDSDPLIAHSAVMALAGASVDALQAFADKHPMNAGVLLALKRNETTRKALSSSGLEPFVKSADPAVAFVAIKWIADDRLTAYRPAIEKLLASADLNYALFLSASAALDRLDGKKPEDRPSADVLLGRLGDDRAPAAVRRLALRLIDPKHPKLQLDTLLRLADHPREDLAAEAVRTLADHSSDQRWPALTKLAQDADRPVSVRAWAVVGLASGPADATKTLIALLKDSYLLLRDESLRALVGTTLSKSDRAAVSELIQGDPARRIAVERLLQTSAKRPPSALDTDAWLELAKGKGDPAAGERIFFHSKVAACARCHAIDGRGLSVGPSLARIGQRIAEQGSEGKRWLLETILQPGKDMAPQFTPWTIVTTDGRTLLGLPRRKGGNAEAYLGTDGKEFTLKRDEIESRRESNVSIMPTDMLQSLTPQELRDLVAYLSQLGAEAKSAPVAANSK